VKDLGIKFQLEWTQCVSDICGTMCACEGWARSTEVYASKCEVMTQDFHQKYLSASHTINGHRQYEFYLSNYWISALWSHLLLFLTAFETLNWNCREIWYEHLYFDLFGSCQALRINYQESQNLKASLLQMTTTDKSKKPTKQKFPNSWSSSMKWSMQSNTKSNLAPIEKMLIYDPHEISQKTSKILRLSSIYSRQARRHLKPEWKWANLKAGFLVWNDPDPWLIRALQPVRDLLSLP
jgi:hypothetical protein